MSIRDELAALLRQHAMPSLEADYPRDEYECCADAILARYGVVELPEGHDDGLGSIQWNVDSRDDLARVRLNHRGQIVSDSVSNPARDVAAARSQAAALLAAAKHVEATDVDR